MQQVPLEIECDTVHLRLQSDDGLIVLDCREQHEHATARIEGTQLVPMSELEARIGELEHLRDAELVVHCHHGGRSLRVVRWLREQGFNKAQSMAGGIDRWSLTIDSSVPRY
jgi:rhodanese-related sulfurtransferase